MLAVILYLIRVCSNNDIVRIQGCRLTHIDWFFTPVKKNWNILAVMSRSHMVSGLGRASMAWPHLTGRLNWHQRNVVEPVVSRSHESRVSSALNVGYILF